MMEDLIKALQVFLKYGNPQYPTSCTHDELSICGIDPSEVSDEDKAELERLGFLTGDQSGAAAFYSFRFGSC